MGSPVAALRRLGPGLVAPSMTRSFFRLSLLENRCWSASTTVRPRSSFSKAPCWLSTTSLGETRIQSPATSTWESPGMSCPGWKQPSLISVPTRTVFSMRPMWRRKVVATVAIRNASSRFSRKAIRCWCRSQKTRWVPRALVSPVCRLSRVDILCSSQTPTVSGSVVGYPTKIGPGSARQSTK